MRNLWLLFVVGLATGFISEKLFVSSQTHFTTADDMYLEGRTSGDLPIDDEDGDDDDGSGSGSGDYAFTDFSEAEEILRRFLNISDTKEIVPAQPQPTAGSPHNPSTSQRPSTTVKHAETPVIIPAGDKKDEEVMSPTADQPTQSTTPGSISKTAAETTTTTVGVNIIEIKDSKEDNSVDMRDVTTPKKQEEVEVIVKEVEDDLMSRNGKDSRLYEPSTPEEVTSENMWERTEVLAAVIACGVVGFLCAVFLLILLAYRMKKKDEGSYDLGDTKVSTTAYHKAPTKEFYA